MKSRLLLLVSIVVAALAVGGLSPARAAATDPVTGLKVGAVQTTGSQTSWTVNVSWTANPDATSYRVVIADHADGTVTAGVAYGNQDTTGTSVQLETSALAAGRDYWVSVQPIAPATGTVAVAQFRAPALDTAAPTVRIAVPSKASRVKAWRIVRGSSSDAGVGVAGVVVFVMEKRGSTWWAFDFAKRKWLKGYHSAKKTDSKSKAKPVVIGVDGSGSWKAPSLKGLKKGKLLVEAVAFDYADNIGAVRTVTRKIH